MTVVKSDQETPSTPPPAYTNIPSISTIPSQQSTSTDTSNGYPFPTPQPCISNTQAHANYGPTPIAEQEGILPYYDPRSPYSMQQAVSRARWRFFWSMVWAFGIWIAVGLVTGSVVIDVEHTDQTVAAEQLLEQVPKY